MQSLPAYLHLSFTVCALGEHNGWEDRSLASEFFIIISILSAHNEKKYLLQ